MADSPMIFAMANPVPEIHPDEARKGCPTAIIATGRSDYPNQINNVMCFPFLFRGTLDAGAKEINDEMKMAVAKTLAEIAREPVPAQVSEAYNGKKFEFGSEYIIPTPFDPRLLYRVSKSVVEAAVASGVARNNITDWKQYEQKLNADVGNSFGVNTEKYTACQKSYVGDSSLGGNGYFTKVAVKKGEVIERCMMMRLTCPEDFGHYNTHVFTWSDDRKVWAISTGIAMFINHSDKPNVQKARNMENDTMEVIALEDLPAHTECFSTYYSKKWREAFQKF